jgi:hypothetical protein
VRSASRLRAVALGVVAALLLATSPSMAQPLEPSLATEGGLGAGAALASMVYAPLKIAYVMSGLALCSASWMWTWGDADVSGEIYRASLAGDYVITPDHLLGKADIEFSGN